MDSSDHESIGGARDNLMQLLGEEELRDAPILVLANNQVRKLKLLMYHSLYMTGDMSGATLMPLLHNIARVIGSGVHQAVPILFCIPLPLNWHMA